VHHRPGIRIAICTVLAVLAGVSAHSQGLDRQPGEKYALLVGVRKYDPAEPLPTLTYSEDDVDELRRVLLASGYRPENIKLMTQRGGAENPRYLPLADRIRKEFALTLKQLDEHDSLVVALAGHGVQFSQEGESFFCPADAALDDESTLIKLSDLATSLEGCRAGFKLLLVDACRNNPKLRAARAAGRAVVDLPSLSRPFVQRPAGGVAALFSCSAGEIAFENPELKHGVFFHYVIQGLGGDADLDGDGQVDVEELASFAKKHVAKFVDNAYGKEQFPELINRTHGAVAIVSRKTLANSVGMKLVLIPPGEFEMGSPDSDKDTNGDEKPRHRVRITRPFYLGATEVTVGQFRRVVESAGYRTEAETDGKGGWGWNVPAKTYGLAPRFHWRFPGIEQTDEHPVVQVTWNDAVAFCNKLSERDGLTPYYHFGAGAKSGGDGYRLPTEAEWEYACRAGSSSKYHFGDDPALLPSFAWIADNSGRDIWNSTRFLIDSGWNIAKFIVEIKNHDCKTHPVGEKRPNAFGLYDMHGSVLEWCSDGYAEGYYRQSPDADPAGPSQASDRVYRGGGWFNAPPFARSALRCKGPPGLRSNDLGFRVARDQGGRRMP
jgi:sulfatase modifying factor 1